MFNNFLNFILTWFTEQDKKKLFSKWREEINDNFIKVDQFAEKITNDLSNGLDGIDTELDGVRADIGTRLTQTDIVEGKNITLQKGTGNQVIISATGDVSEQDIIDKIQEHNISPSSHEDLRAKTDLIETTGTDKEFLARDGKYHQIQGGGATIFDVDTYEVFTATEPTNTFTIPLMTENKIVELKLEGLEPIKDVDYTIDKTTGVVTLLNHTLQVGESIYYKTLFSAENGVVFDEDEVIEGSVVFDADTLEGHSADYFAKTSDLDSKITTGTDFNTIVDNGKYAVINGTNTPDGSTDCIFTIDVTTHYEGALYQKAECLWSSLGNSYKTYERYCASGVWQGWQQIATTTKTVITPTPLTGIKINSNNSYIENNRLYVALSISKVDDSIMEPINNVVTFGITNLVKDTALSACAYDASGSLLGATNAVLSRYGNGFVAYNTIATTVTRIEFSGISDFI